VVEVEEFEILCKCEM